MTHYGRLAEYQFTDKTVEDIRGSAVYGLDDKKLGKIDDVIFDHSTGDIRYVVVDTGGWLSSKEFLVPAGQLKPSTEHKNDYRVDLTKTQIESFPPYDEETLESQEKWGDYENRYRSAYGTGGVGSTPTRGTGSLLGARWTAFESRVRSDRDSIVSHCRLCSVRPSVQRADVERERKIS